MTQVGGCGNATQADRSECDVRGVRKVQRGEEGCAGLSDKMAHASVHKGDCEHYTGSPASTSSARRVTVTRAVPGPPRGACCVLTLRAGLANDDDALSKKTAVRASSQRSL